MEEQVQPQPKIEAFLNSRINLTIKIDDRTYELYSPNGAAYTEVEWACREFEKLVTQIKDKVKEEKERETAEGQKAEETPQ